MHDVKATKINKRLKKRERLVVEDVHQGVYRALNEERGSGWEMRDWGGEGILHKKNGIIYKVR